LIFFASLARIASSTRSGSPRADLDQQLHHVGVGAAVQRTLQRADRADDRRIEIGQCRRGDARGERRRVQLVIGVQRQRDVEGARRQRARTLPFSM
jgi:hypothetical protein